VRGPEQPGPTLSRPVGSGAGSVPARPVDPAWGLGSELRSAWRGCWRPARAWERGATAPGRLVRVPRRQAWVWSRQVWPRWASQVSASQAHRRGLRPVRQRARRRRHATSWPPVPRCWTTHSSRTHRVRAVLLLLPCFQFLVLWRVHRPGPWTLLSVLARAVGVRDRAVSGTTKSWLPVHRVLILCSLDLRCDDVSCGQRRVCLTTVARTSEISRFPPSRSAR
jgi:hypothetical protein